MPSTGLSRAGWPRAAGRGLPRVLRPDERRRARDPGRPRAGASARGEGGGMSAIEPIDELEAGELSVEFEGQEPQELLEWALERFSPRIALSTAFQIDGVALLDMAYELDPGDRGLQRRHRPPPEETFELIEQLRDRYPGLNLDSSRPTRGRCRRWSTCTGRPLLPPGREAPALLQRPQGAAADPSPGPLDAWFTGLRRDQWATRTDIRKVEIDHDHGGIVKLIPLADWTEEEVWDYVRERDVPITRSTTVATLDRLRTCTRAIAPGEFARVDAGGGRITRQGVRDPLRGRDGRIRARAARDLGEDERRVVRPDRRTEREAAPGRCRRCSPWSRTPRSAASSAPSPTRSWSASSSPQSRRRSSTCSTARGRPDPRGRRPRRTGRAAALPAAPVRRRGRRFRRRGQPCAGRARRTHPRRRSRSGPSARARPRPPSRSAAPSSAYISTARAHASRAKGCDGGQGLRHGALSTLHGRPVPRRRRLLGRPREGKGPARCGAVVTVVAPQIEPELQPLPVRRRRSATRPPTSRHVPPGRRDVGELGQPAGLPPCRDPLAAPQRRRRARALQLHPSRRPSPRPDHSRRLDRRRAPSLAKRLRDELGAQIDERHVDLANPPRELRPWVQAHSPLRPRRDFFEALVEESLR